MSLATTLYNLACKAWALEDHAAALKYANAAIAVAEEEPGQLKGSKIDFKELYHVKAGLLGNLGQTESAKKFNIKAIELAEEEQPLNHQFLGNAYLSLAVAHGTWPHEDMDEFLYYHNIAQQHYYLWELQEMAAGRIEHLWLEPFEVPVVQEHWN